MKRILTLLSVMLLAGSLGLAQSSAGSSLSKVAGITVAGNYGRWSTRIAVGSASGSSISLTMHNGYVSTPDGRNFVPFLTTASFTVGSGSTQETVTPSATSGCFINAPLDGCIVTVTTSNAHQNGELVVSGDGGLFEAINDAGNAGGGMVQFHLHELVTLATGAQTTDTTANLEPANSLLFGVTGVVNTTITSSCTGWELGDATTAARFTANDTTLTAGEKAIGKVQLTTGVASATTGFSNAGTAAKIRITCAGGNPGAGKINVSSWGLVLVAPNN